MDFFVKNKMPIDDLQPSTHGDGQDPGAAHTPILKMGMQVATVEALEIDM